MSGRERSSTKRNLSCAARTPGWPCAGHVSITGLFIFTMDGYLSYYENCTLCPRNCHVNRLKDETGVCGSGADLFVSRAALHMWEEPCISGDTGSGTVFFSGCNLHCIFCQNHEISGRSPFGKRITTERLCDIFLELEEKGALNINLVTSTHYIPSVREAIIMAKRKGLSIPVVYNTGGYESVSSLKLLEGLIDIYLPDLKYFDPVLSAGLSHADDYEKVAKDAIREMVRQTGEPVFDKNGIMKKGVIVRHLVLPSHTKDSIKILDYLHDTYKDRIYISIMSQYTPIEENCKFFDPFPELKRSLTNREYKKVIDHALMLDIKNGFTQEGKAASESFIPSFKTLEGV